MRRLGTSDLDVSPLCLGGNVFGWTADEDASFAVLDAYVAAGGNFIDTADTYSSWAPGHTGGESEAVIGRWLAARGNRDDVVIATKVGKMPGSEGLSAQTIRRAAEASLQRLQTDRIDVYYAHADDEDTPLAETLGAFGELVAAGMVRHVAASNYTAPRLAEALAVAEREGLPRYVALQTHYNLVERGYEDDLAEVVAAHGLGTLPHWALAKGFLTGKYRPGGPEVDSPRAPAASVYLDRGVPVLEALDEVAREQDTTVPAVALAWLAAQPTVVCPVASARNLEQLADLLPAQDLTLTDAQVARLTDASA
ncbi:aldo/keto reductase [Baekduia soli]|uniref:Aldo/keto reductase n=1 Tax=Baekduia soli TaxID=496014 RepID=A0A5B8U459_9ACTN|nr:aldo/keto reductase [Baekduia soli]QEC47879.1 aldo/keto reductase [Baekduia soli]